MESRKEEMPDNPELHYRINPSFPHSRWYYLKKLRQLVEWGRDNYMNLPADKSKIADLVCGTKPYKILFNSDKFEYLGIDLPWNPHADIHVGINSKIDADNESFEYVLSTQVLEHVDDPDLYLSEAYRVLKKGGRLILTTHGYWMYHPDPTDYWRWTSAGLKKVVEKHGFETVGFKGIIGRMAMGLQLFQDGLIFKFPKFLHPLLTAPLQLLILIFDKLQRQQVVDFDACTYLIIGQKK